MGGAVFMTDQKKKKKKDVHDATLQLEITELRLIAGNH